MNLDNLLEERRTVIDSALNYYLPGEEEYPRNIHRAMRYSVFAGGKRIRPLLTLLTAELFTPDWKRALPAACALELIHTYSLIHDDLPAMDDDDYRRGRLTSHKVFGEGTAILAGDALLTLAFELLTDKNHKKSEFGSSYWRHVDSQAKLDVIFEIARAAGIKGMVGGQAVDLESEGKRIDVETLEYIDTHKTGALVQASVRIGALLAEAGARDVQKLGLYGRLLGRAFQIVDDLLDVEGNEEKMGKARGMDVKKEKANYISLCGLVEAKVRRDQLYSQALKELEHYGEKAAPLRESTRFILYRDF
ncbi:MAG: polyprenyl synthetase family protein [Dethiobacter sp.]|jgi:geranylgeranyl diphosphate synthase type II|nr:MAG: polyprenyl synthetase family protein [Dethiobacter sp.]